MTDAFVPSKPTSAFRVVTSSLFAYAFVAISAYFVARTTAEQVAGAKGLVFYLVYSIAWLLAGIVGGFVAGYRSVQKGWIAGFLVGVLTPAGILGVFYLYAVSERIRIADFFAYLFSRASTLERAALLALFALNIPACTYGGIL